MAPPLPFRFGRLWSHDPAMEALFMRAREVAASPLPVVIFGETGTGKELCAEALHSESSRSQGPYVVVDCAAMPEALIESELFGHVAGAFTGAEVDRSGAFEEASGGTLFIDELGELPLHLQPRLLRVLERNEVRRVGSEGTVPVDVRVVAATHRNLSEEVDAGRFRVDLFYRLQVVQLVIPPLRERPADVLFLAERFLAEAPFPLALNDGVRARLMAHDWPGNVRELRNVMEQGAALSDGEFRLPPDFGRPLVPVPEQPEFVPLPGGWDWVDLGEITRPLWENRSYKEAKERVLADFEQGYLRDLLRRHHGNVSQAAREAGIHRNILHRMMARYGIDRSDP